MTNPGHKQTSNQEIVRAPKSAVRRLEKALPQSLTENSRRKEEIRLLKADLHATQTTSDIRMRVAKQHAAYLLKAIEYSRKDK